MRWIWESILGIFQWLIAGVLNIMGTGVIEVLTLNIGAGADGTYASAFDVVFRSIVPFYNAFQAFAMGLLIINFIWQLIKIMTTPEGGSETPFALTARTFAAGIAIGFSAQMVSVAQQFFAVLYNALLKTGSLSSFTLTVNADLGSDVDGLISVVISLGFSILIGWEFIMFLAEVVERYIILGILFYTSPLAFSVAGSKSTSSIFSSWMRMLFSQMLLMCFNVFFYKLFLQGYSSYGAAISGLGDAAGNTGLATVANRAGLTMLWNLMMFAVLHVGTRMDAYMATLGLSTAQAGRGLGVAITSGFTSAFRTIATAGMVSKAATAPIRKAIGSARENYKGNHQKPTMDKNGNWTADSIAKVATGKSSAQELSGKTVGGAFMQPNSSFANALQRANADASTAHVDAASQRVSMTTRPDAQGRTRGIDFIPVTDENRATLQKQQVAFGEVGGVQYAMEVHGSQNDRAALLAGGPQMEKANKDWTSGGKGRTSEAIRDENGDLTGGYHFTQTGKDGSLQQSFDILPASMFDGDTLPPESKMVQWGGQDCYQVDTTARDKAGGQLEHPLLPSDEQRMADAYNSTFSSPAIGQTTGDAGLNLAYASTDKNGIIEGIRTDGTRVGLAPAAEFQAASGTADAQIRQAENGASYIEVPLGNNMDGSARSAGEAFKQIPKDANGVPISGVTAPAAGMSGEETAQHLQSQLTTPINASSASFDEKSGIWTASTAAHEGVGGVKIPEQSYAYAPASQYAPADAGRDGISTISAKNGETFYKVPLQEGESAGQAFVGFSGASRVETPNVGGVNPRDVMSTARENFRGGQIPEEMTHCESLQGGAMRFWNAETGQQQFALPTAAFTTDQQKQYITSTNNQSYMLVNASAGAKLSDVAQEKALDSRGQYLSASLNMVPQVPKAAPKDGDNVRKGARARRGKK